jgi:hypothetical protein
MILERRLRSMCEKVQGTPKKPSQPGAEPGAGPGAALGAGPEAKYGAAPRTAKTTTEN